MVTGGGLTMPEPLHDEDTHLGFKRFEVCSAANGWDEAKKLPCLPMLLRGHAWAVFDSLGEGNIDTYDHLKAALLLRLNPDTNGCSREIVSKEVLRWGESIDKLACDLLDRASSGLLANVRDD